MRIYIPRGFTGLRFTYKPESVFFHLKFSCVASQSLDPVNEKSLIISGVDKMKLNFLITPKHVKEKLNAKANLFFV